LVTSDCDVFEGCESEFSEDEACVDKDEFEFNWERLLSDSELEGSEYDWEDGSSSAFRIYLWYVLTFGSFDFEISQVGTNRYSFLK